MHGALCISYSGQCLTSEAIGGRSANRGACAQACRLPYELVVDGELQVAADRAYLLSPEDLEASALVPDLVRARRVVAQDRRAPQGPRVRRRDHARSIARRSTRRPAPASRPPRTSAGRALQTFTRGSGPGFFPGVDHQRLVEGRACDHRGLEVGDLRAVESCPRARWSLVVELAVDLARGDGILVEGGFASEGEVGGRVWDALGRRRRRRARARRRHGARMARAGREARQRARQDRAREVTAGVPHQRPRGREEILNELAQAPARTRLDVADRGARRRAASSSRRRTGAGGVARVTGDAAHRAGAVGAARRDGAARQARQARRLAVRARHARRAGSRRATIVPVSSLNRARRALVEALAVDGGRTRTRRPVHRARTCSPRPDRPRTARPPGGLFVLCRNARAGDRRARRGRRRRRTSTFSSSPGRERRCASCASAAPSWAWRRRASASRARRRSIAT